MRRTTSLMTFSNYGHMLDPLAMLVALFGVTRSSNMHTCTCRGDKAAAGAGVHRPAVGLQ